MYCIGLCGLGEHINEEFNAGDCVKTITKKIIFAFCSFKSYTGTGRGRRLSLERHCCSGSGHIAQCHCVKG